MSGIFRYGKADTQAITTGSPVTASTPTQKTQTGRASIGTGSTIVFPVAFTSTPVVTFISETAGGYVYAISSITATSAVLYFTQATGSAAGTLNIAWTATGT